MTRKITPNMIHFLGECGQNSAASCLLNCLLLSFDKLHHSNTSSHCLVLCCVSKRVETLEQLIFLAKSNASGAWLFLTKALRRSAGFLI